MKEHTIRSGVKWSRGMKEIRYKTNGHKTRPWSIYLFVLYLMMLQQL
jgi:trehalose utilization protein